MNLSIISGIFTYKKGKVIRFLGAGALLTLAMYFVADALASYASYLLRQNAPSVMRKNDQNAPARIAPSEDYGVVARRNLFEAKSGQAPARTPAPPQAPPSRGALSARFALVGTALSGSGMGDMAIIKRKDKNKDLLLYEGDRLDEYTVKDVMRHKAVLSGPSGEETLVMKYESGAGKRPPKRTPPRTAPPAREQRTPGEQNQPNHPETALMTPPEASKAPQETPAAPPGGKERSLRPGAGKAPKMAPPSPLRRPGKG